MEDIDLIKDFPSKTDLGVVSLVGKNCSDIMKFYEKQTKDLREQIYKEGDLKIYDNKVNYNILTNITNYCQYKAIWRHHGSHGTSDDCLFLQHGVFDNKYFEKLFYDVIIPGIDLENKNDLKITRAYINGHTFGRTGDWHQDGPGLGPTIMLYCNNKWDTRWEGGTFYYKNKTTHEMIYVDYLPGRIVVHQPHLMHRACDMSGYAAVHFVNRYSLAYHTVDTKKYPDYVETDFSSV